MLAASCSFSWEWFSPCGITLLSHSLESIFAESCLSPSLLFITCIVSGTEDNFQSGSGLERFTHLFINPETLILLISFKHPLYLHMLGVSCMGHGVPSARDAHPSLFVHLLLTQVPCGEGNGTPLQYSCLENPMGGGAWQAAVHGVTKSQTWMSDWTDVTSSYLNYLFKGPSSISSHTLRS